MTILSDEDFIKAWQTCGGSPRQMADITGLDERSMAQTVAAFNVITGNIMSEQEGWLFMLLLKLVRQHQTEGWHQDSSEDAIAYAALMAESWQKEPEDDIEITFTFYPDDEDD